MRQRGRRYGPIRLTQTQRKTNAILLLCGCTTSRLHELTAQEIANTTGVKLPTAEAMLSQERARRG